MLDATLKKLVQLLQHRHPTDVRCAAARVLGELGVRDGEISGALLGALKDPDSVFRLQVLTTIGQLRIEQALPDLLDKAREGGAEGEAAAQAAAHLGATGARALQGLMSQVAPGVRRRIAAALGTGGTASASSAATDMLLDTDPGVVDAAARALIGEVVSFSRSQKAALADHVLNLLKPKKTATFSRTSEAALLRLLAALGDKRSEAVFWSHLALDYPVEVRASALGAIGGLSLPTNREKLKLLFGCAAENDFRIAAPAIMILKNVKATDKTVGDWLPLLLTGDVAARRFAIEKLSGKDTRELADALLLQLRHPDRSLRQEAAARLGSMQQGQSALAKALLQAEDPDEAWNLARAQAGIAGEYPATLKKKIFALTGRYLEGGDRRADAFLYLLREIDSTSLRRQLEERAVALRKKKDYKSALVYLRLLARDPACAEELRFEMAACGLKASDHELAAESRSADPALQQFARLIHSHDTDPTARLKKARWLEPEDLFYLGFHFVEGNRQERDFGAQALRLLLQRWPRSKIAKDGRSKLRSAGLK